MSTNVKIFKSTDTGAPGLTGQAGKLIELLDAILIDGINPKTISALSRSGSTATATCVGHGYIVGDCLLIAGADQAEYNGEVYITTVPDTDTFTFAVDGAAVTPATGASITAKKAPAGWTKPYNGTNLAAYRMGGGNQRYLRLDDTGTAYGARVVGYEAMTGISSGSGQFPTSIQESGGLYAAKSSVATSVVRDWVAAVTDRHLILWVNVVDSAIGTSACALFFGDFMSRKSGDQFNTILIAGTSAAFSGSSFQKVNIISTSITGHYCARSYTQLGSSIAVGKHVDGVKSGTSSADIGSSGLIYPNPSDGGLYLSEIFIHEPNNFRGTLPGVWAPLHGRPLANYDTFDGAGDVAGRSFMALHLYNMGQFFLETSNTWNL
ncbi:MAG: hypothetical protein M0Q95_10995 [Porticoccaceae bacterium]|nr:hypothetical protein [Porticoccaceae bacterium]